LANIEWNSELRHTGCRRALFVVSGLSLGAFVGRAIENLTQNRTLAGACIAIGLLLGLLMNAALGRRR
jgi:hypothetical protein